MKADGIRDLDLARSHIDTYLDMENLLDTGKARAIGVANYSLGYLREVVARASVTPAVVQVELHPQLPQRELVEFCQAQGIHCTAYSPLGSTGAPVAALEEVEELARQKGVTPASILLGYHG
jgi:glycerol 2-dehydrogenase (NADP+)